MKCQRMLSLALIALGLCFATSSQLYAQASDSRSLFDLKFGGGSAVEYIEAIQRADEQANIVVTSDVALIEVEPLELKKVGFEAAVYLLDHMTQQLPDGRIVQIRINRTPNPSDGLSIYRVDAEVERLQGAVTPQSSVSSVWSLAAIIKGDTGAEDVLTAIETALDLFGDGPNAELRFHDETSLLMLRGNAEQSNAVEAIIHELAGSLKSREILKTLNGANTELNATRKQLEDSVQDATRWQARAEMYEKQVDSLRMQLAETHAEIRQIESKNRSVIAELSAQIQSLEREFKDRKN